MVSTNVIGICMTCNNVSTCVHRRRHRKPVWHCEEFDNHSDPVDNLVMIMDDDEFLGVQEKETNHLIGLCSNCDNRKTCKYPKPESGVWHCEEYK